tara:strand:- start:1144 stop:1695 length:552 start_codon:yes stop_codon:yes gene_type:complete
MTENNNKVAIVRDEQGNTLRISKNNPEFAFVRLQQDRVMVGSTGWLNKKTVSTLLHGRLEDLQSLNLESLDTVTGKIIVKEQLEPFSSDNPDRDLKMAGNTGIVCCYGGAPIYRKTFFTVNANAEDTLVAHDNTEDIKIALNAETASEQTAKEVKNESKSKKKEIVKEQVEEAIEMEDETFEL